MSETEQKLLMDEVIDLLLNGGEVMRLRPKPNPKPKSKLKKK